MTQVQSSSGVPVKERFQTYEYNHFAKTKKLWNKETTSQNAIGRGLQKVVYSVAAVAVSVFEGVQNALKAVANAAIKIANRLSKKVEVITPQATPGVKNQETPVQEQTTTVAAQKQEKTTPVQKPEETTPVQVSTGTKINRRNVALGATAVAFTATLVAAYYRPDLVTSAKDVAQQFGDIATNLLAKGRQYLTGTPVKDVCLAANAPVYPHLISSSVCPANIPFYS